MTKKRLLEDIKQNPARIYRAPADVLRDRRFGDLERLEILKAWREVAPDQTNEMTAMIEELEGRLYPANGHAAE